MAEKKDEEDKGWKSMLMGFLSTLTHQATNTIVELTKISLNEIKEEKSKAIANLKQQVVSAVLLTIGLVFLCVGVVLLINEVLTTRSSVGYIFMGLILLVAGLAITKKK